MFKDIRLFKPSYGCNHIPGNNTLDTTFVRLNISARCQQVQGDIIQAKKHRCRAHTLTVPSSRDKKKGTVGYIDRARAPATILGPPDTRPTLQQSNSGMISALYMFPKPNLTSLSKLREPSTQNARKVKMKRFGVLQQNLTRDATRALKILQHFVVGMLLHRCHVVSRRPVAVLFTTPPHVVALVIMLSHIRTYAVALLSCRHPGSLPHHLI